MDLLKDEFGEHFISRPLKSCDLTPLDYFLWDYVKAHVDTGKPALIGALEDTLKHLFVRYWRKCWKEYAKIGLIVGAVAVNICMK